jgi:CIC family chloride channel protein
MPNRSRLRVLWRAFGRPWWSGVSRYIVTHDIDEGWLVIGFAAVIGAGAGYTIAGFYAAVDLVQAGSGWLGSQMGFPAGSRWIPFVIIAAGLALARWLRLRLAPGSSEEMVPYLIHSVVRSGGEIPVRQTFGRLLGAALTIGSGGSLGTEGPVAVAGAGIGSGLARLFRFRPNRVKVLLGCGVASGISAAFNAPIAGVMFALEIVLGTFTAAAMGPVVVASVVGAVVSRSLLGDTPAFDVPTEFLLVSARELGFYTLLGLSCGLLAVLFTRGFFLTRGVLARLPGRGWLASVVGGVLLATASLIHPQLLGAGREGITLVLFGELTGLAALSLGLLKILTSGLTAGGGGAGGLFTPSLFVGASFGSFFGLTAQSLFPAMPITPEAYALAGMAAVVAGATFAPLTAIIMIFEITDDYGLILPLMLVCVVSYLVARSLYGESLYSEALLQAGERIRHGVDRSALERIRVAECYNRSPDVVLEDAPLQAVLHKLRGSRQTDFPVVNRDLELCGMLSYQEIARALGEEGLSEIVLAADLALGLAETVTPADTLLEAIRLMGLRDLDYLPVVESPGSRRLLGLVGRADIMEAYQTYLMLNP